MSALFPLAIGIVIGAAVAWITASIRLRKIEHRAVVAESSAEALRRQQEAGHQEIVTLREKLEREQRARTQAETLLETERRNLDEQRRLLNEAQGKLTDTFKAVSGDVLAAQSQSFLQLAQQSFTTLRAEADGGLALRQEAIEALVGPLGEALKNYGEMVREIEKQRAGAHGALASEIKGLLDVNQTLQRETGNLTSALKGGFQVRGRWGEMTLRRVVELAGMSEHCDFTEQETLHSEAGRMRPDLIVELPGGHRLAVDVKAPLQPFLDAMAATGEAERRQMLERYSARVRAHMNQLAGRAYWEQLHPSPEMVVLFLPGESFFGAALEQDPLLIEDGIQKRVVIATPTTLIALLHAVAYGWRQEQVQKSAREVSDLGKELYDRLRIFAGHFEDVGSGIKRAVESYNRAGGSLERRVLASARKFHSLGAASGDELPEAKPIDQMPLNLHAAEEPEQPADDPQLDLSAPETLEKRP